MTQDGCNTRDARYLDISSAEYPTDGNSNHSLDKIDQHDGYSQPFGTADFVGVHRADISASDMPDIDIRFPFEEQIPGRNRPNQISRQKAKDEGKQRGSLSVLVPYLYKITKKRLEKQPQRKPSIDRFFAYPLGKGYIFALIMNKEELIQLLKDFRRGDLGEAEVLKYLLTLKSESLGFARIDHHRHLRKSFPEVIFGEGKTPAQTTEIALKISKGGAPLLVTRVSKEHFKAVKRRIRNAHYHSDARVITANEPEKPSLGRGTILVVTAGTSDIPVAEEAVLTAMMSGNPVERLYDVGVAGLHRLLNSSDQLLKANVVIVVAGMEGALPSVVGGLVDVPVIAVPTSVGYGASFKGVAALLGMLNSCSSGVTVVNIDNGFGAGFAASLMNRKK